MRPRDVQNRLEKFSGYAAGEIDQRIRPLREVGILRSGPRGRHVPNAKLFEIVHMILAMVSRRPSEAGPVSIKAADLRLVPPPGVISWNGIDFDNNEYPLAVVLSSLLRSPNLMGYRRLEVAIDGSRAWLTIDHDEHGTLDLVFIEADMMSEAKRAAQDLKVYKNQGAAYCGHRFVVGVGVIRQFAFEIEDVSNTESYAS